MPPDLFQAYEFSFFADSYPASPSLFLPPSAKRAAASVDKEEARVLDSEEKGKRARRKKEEASRDKEEQPQQDVDLPSRKRKRGDEDEKPENEVERPAKRTKPDEQQPFKPPRAPKAMLSVSQLDGTNGTRPQGATQTPADKDIAARQNRQPSAAPHRAWEPTLTDDVLFPSLKGLTAQSYSPYLLEEPIQLAWSAAYYTNLMSFFSSCSPPDRWRAGPNASFHPRDTFPIMQLLLSSQPNKNAIRAVVGNLGVSFSFKGLPNHLHLRLRALRDTMQWIWDDKKDSIRLEHAAWLILQSSQDKRLLPIYILLREHASTLRFSDAVEISQRELLAYLTSKPSSDLSGRERRALRLLEWLNEEASRWYTFFSLPDRSLRQGGGGEEAWEWWLREPGEGEYRDKRALDKWEREMMRKEAWRE